MNIQEVFANRESDETVELSCTWVSCCTVCHRYIEEKGEHSQFLGTAEDYEEFKNSCTTYEDTDAIEEVDENVYHLYERNHDDTFICRVCKSSQDKVEWDEKSEMIAYIEELLHGKKSVTVTPGIIKTQDDYNMLKNIIRDRNRLLYDIQISKDSMVKTQFGELNKFTIKTLG